MLLPTDAHENEQDARFEAENFVQSALDALSAHVAILDESGEIIAVNAAWRTFAEVNGYQHEQYGIGINYLQVCENARNSPDAQAVAEGIRAVTRGTLPEFTLEYPCHSPKERRWFVVRVSRFDWHGSSRLIIAHQNVSELKNAQVEIESSRSRLEAILDNINNGILTINEQGIIETANFAAGRIFGYRIQDMMGRSLQDLIVEPFPTNNAYQHFNREYGNEITGRRADGVLFPIYFAINKLRLNNTNIYTCIIQDIAYRKRMEAEILEREKIQVALEKERELRVLKNRFLSMMGHELNTPLTAISLSHDMLKKYGHIATEEENNQALDNIQQQVEHLRDMVKDVISLSRTEIEGMELEVESVDFITYCRNIVEEFTFTYHRTHRVDFECEERDIRAEIDRKTLRRVFTNLLSNAVKYSPEGGQVLFRLNADYQNSLVQIQVEDSGIGIPQDDIPRLFEPFHRAINVGKLPGTGLGLAIVKQIIDLHHGQIDIESVPNQGTMFTITLPMRYTAKSELTEAAD